MRIKSISLWLVTLLSISFLNGEDVSLNRIIHSYDETGTSFLSEFSLQSYTSGINHVDTTRQEILWHKMYQFTMTKSLAFGYNNTIFFGGSDYPPVEVALYPIENEDEGTPDPIWRFESPDEFASWFVAATETADLYLGINYLSANFDDLGDGYCYLHLWHGDSPIPVWTYDFSGYIPVSVEPLVITDNDQKIFVGMRNPSLDETYVYVFTPHEPVPVDVVTFSGSITQIMRVSDDGVIIGLLQGINLSIYDRGIDSLRQMIRIGASTTNFDMSSCGDHIVSGWRDAVIHQWDGIRYRERFRYRDTDGIWYHGNCIISGDGSTAILYAYLNDYSLNRVHLINLLTYDLVWTYEFARNPGSDLQMLPAQSSISDDGSLFVLGNWGDQSPDNPAMMVFRREFSEPYFVLSPTGSISRTAITKKSPYYVSGGGKLVHMNNWGSGTNLYSIDLLIDVDYGQLSGTITAQDTGLPISGANIVYGDWDLTKSDVTGSYYFPSLIAGTNSLTVSKVGFYDYDIDVFSILPDETAILDIELKPLPTISLEGRLLKSDNPTEGISDGLVKLSGYAAYETTTDSEGFFIIEGIFVNQSYHLLADHPLYEEYQQDLNVGIEDIDLGDITLIESPFPVDNVLAIQTDNNNVFLNWSEPVPAMLKEFSYDNGECVAALGFPSGNPNSVLGAVHHHHAKILFILWHLSGTTTHEEVNLFLFALDEDGYPVSTQPLFVAENVPSVQNDWNVYELPSPYTAPYGFLVGISASAGGHLGLSIDNGDNMKLSTHYYVFDYTIGLAFNVYTSGNYLLRAWGYDYGYVSYPDFDYRMENDDQLEGVNTSYRRLRDLSDRNDQRMVSEQLSELIPSGVTLGRDIPFKPGLLPVNDIKQTSRSLEYYQIYRLDKDDLFRKENWDFVSSSSDNQYLDTSWIEIPDGLYRYGITAVYTDGSESPAAFSNVLDKNLNSDLTISVSTNSNDSPLHAFVEIDPVDPEDNPSYIGLVEETGVAYIPDIRKGIYSITISLAGFETYILDELELIEEDIFLIIELVEKLLPVDDLNYSILESNGYTGVYLEWSLPLSQRADSGVLFNNRALQGYTITRNDEVIVEQTTETFLEDYPLLTGIYNYGVKAIYDTGVSETIYTGGIELIRPVPLTQLLNVYPNPFTLSTNLLFSISEEQPVKIEIYNIRGNLVRTVLDEVKSAGEHTTFWFGENDRGERVASGLYICRMVSGNYRGYRKILLLK